MWVWPSVFPNTNSLFLHLLDLGMKTKQQAANIFHREGLAELCKRAIRYLSRQLLARLWCLFYRIKAVIADDKTVTISGIHLDLDHSSISNDMTKRIRSKQYEQVETKFITSYLSPDSPTIDIGSGIGYTTCLISRHSHRNIPVIGVEANETLIPVIERNKNINREEFDIVHSAYDSQKDNIDFLISDDFWSSSRYNRNSNQQRTTVVACSVDDLITDFDLSPPIQLVADIEGGEHDLITNEMDTIKNYCGILIIEFHSFLEHDIEYYNSQLEAASFECIDAQQGVRVYSNTSFRPKE